MNQSFEIISRALIIHENKILLVIGKGQNYFLPGGYIEFGEYSQETLARELKEEFDGEADSIEFFDHFENIYTISNGLKHHEFNLLYKVTLKNYNVTSLESHIKFEWFPKEQLTGLEILPEKLKTIFSNLDF